MRRRPLPAADGQRCATRGLALPSDSANPYPDKLRPGGWRDDVVKRRTALLMCCVLALALIPGTGTPAAGRAVSRAPTPDAPRPNILLLVSDDQAWTTFSRDLMPSVYSRLVDQGILFKRAYVNTPLCCPSRAQILTGSYEHHTGVDAKPCRSIGRRSPRRSTTWATGRCSPASTSTAGRRAARGRSSIAGRASARPSRPPIRCSTPGSTRTVRGSTQRLSDRHPRRPARRLHRRHASRSAVLRDVRPDDAASPRRRSTRTTTLQRLAAARALLRPGHMDRTSPLYARRGAAHRARSKTPTRASSGCRTAVRSLDDAVDDILDGLGRSLARHDRDLPVRQRVPVRRASTVRQDRRLRGVRTRADGRPLPRAPRARSGRSPRRRSSRTSTSHRRSRSWPGSRGTPTVDRSSRCWRARREAPGPRC